MTLTLPDRQHWPGQGHSEPPDLASVMGLGLGMALGVDPLAMLFGTPLGMAALRQELP